MSIESHCKYCYRLFIKSDLEKYFCSFTCRKNRNKNQRDYYYKHRTEINKRNLEYRIKYSKIYFASDKGKEALRRSCKKYQKKWLSISKNKIAHNLRTRIGKALKGLTKGLTTEKFLGCSFDFFKNYLESIFKEGMNWQNYGLWHIDHVIPCASFDLTDLAEQKKCFHYTNLQPLWAKENILKRDKLIISEV